MVVVTCPRFWPQGPACGGNNSANIYGDAETNNEFLSEIGAELWTSLGGGEVPGSFYVHELQADG